GDRGRRGARGHADHTVGGHAVAGFHGQQGGGHRGGARHDGCTIERVVEQHAGGAATGSRGDRRGGEVIGRSGERGHPHGHGDR
ncbi:hypothetical protein B8W90_12755, partial [Staphylococcus hominis]